jgi:hypothetical protein
MGDAEFIGSWPAWARFAAWRESSSDSTPPRGSLVERGERLDRPKLPGGLRKSLRVEQPRCRNRYGPTVGRVCPTRCAGSNWTAARRERTRFRTETALELAEMERTVWGDNWIELNVDLQRLEARLAVAGVPDDLVQAFHDISVRCWRDLQEDIDMDAEQPGINKEFLDARRLVHAAARAYKKSRMGLSVEAVAGVSATLARPGGRRP